MILKNNVTAPWTCCGSLNLVNNQNILYLVVMYKWYVFTNYASDQKRKLLLASLFLIAISHRILWITDISKKATITTLNSHASKTRTNPPSKLRFFESSLNFFQNNVVLYSLFSRWYTWGGPTFCNPWRFQHHTSLKRLMLNQEKHWVRSFLSIYFGNKIKLSKSCNFLLLGKSNHFT